MTQQPGLTELLLESFILLQCCMIMLWLISVRLQDVSFIDSFWPTGFVIVAAATFAVTGPATIHHYLLLGLTTVWGARLAVYLFLRWRREGPDPRYTAMLKNSAGSIHLASLGKVFLLQGVILWIVSLPVQAGPLMATGAAPGAVAWIGLALAIIGILFESIGDLQLQNFRADPANTGQVMNRGLWRYTRHPNYFGDACVWWGIYLVALDAGAPLWTAAGPALLNWTLLKWSGAALLERRLKHRRPGYEAYIAQTSGFIPWPPKEH